MNFPIQCLTLTGIKKFVNFCSSYSCGNNKLASFSEFENYKNHQISTSIFEEFQAVDWGTIYSNIKQALNIKVYNPFDEDIKMYVCFKGTGIKNNP